MSDLSGMESDGVKGGSDEHRTQRRMSLRERYARQQTLKELDAAAAAHNAAFYAPSNHFAHVGQSTLSSSGSGSVGGSQAEASWVLPPPPTGPPPRRERSSQYIPGTGSMSPLETRRVNSEYYGVSPLAGSSSFEFPLPPSSSGDELNQGMRGMTLNRPGPSTSVRNQRTYSLSTIQSNQPQYPGAPTSPTGTSMHHPDSVHSSQQGSDLNSAYTFPPQQFQFPPPGAAAYAESIGSDESITYEGVGEAQKVKRNKSSKKSGLKEEVATNIFFGPPTKLNYNRRKSEGPVEKKKSADSDEKGNGGLFAKFHRKKNRASSPSSMDKSDTSSAGGSVYLPPEHQQQQYFAPTDIPVTVPEALIQRTSGQMSRQPDIAPVHPLLADAVPVAYKPITPGLRRSKSFSAGRPSTSGDKTDEEGEEGGQLAKFRARRAAEKARLAAGQQSQ